MSEVVAVRDRAVLRGQRSTETRQYIPEIQGLRTIALLMVATFHIWFGRVSGGVDVFLLISAYLLTRSFVAAAERRREIRFVPFVLRKFSRLLPAAAATILLSLAVALAIMSQRNWDDLASQALASITYTMNFWLQGNAVDYLAQARSTASVFQHFWSLSIQGQVFILWPLIHVIVIRYARGKSRFWLFVVFAIVFAASFAWSIVQVERDQQFAYFDTLGRLWEFAAGSLFALIAPLLRIPSRVKSWMMWGGVAAMVATGWVMPVQSAFPGVAALWPVVAAGLVLIAADSPVSQDDHRNWLLTSPLLERSGRYMYALYLTHWPALVLFAVATGIERPDPLQGLGILLISAVASVTIYHAVEAPAARATRSPQRSKAMLRQMAAIAVSVALVLGASFAIPAWLGKAEVAQAEQATALDLSKMGVNADRGAVFDEVFPGESLNASFAQEPGADCAPDDPYRAGICRDWGELENPEREIVIVGSSHSAALSATLMETIEQQPGWKVRTYTSPGCYFYWVSDNKWPEELDGCRNTWKTATQYIVDTSPDMVFTVSSLTRTDGGETFFRGSRGFAAWTSYLNERTGTLVVGMRDNPRTDFSPLECAERSGFDDAECSFETDLRPDELRGYGDEIARAGGLFIDLNAAICPGGTCSPALGGLVTWVDNSHLGEYFARSLAGMFAEQVNRRAGWYPPEPWP